MCCNCANNCTLSLSPPSGNLIWIFRMCRMHLIAAVNPLFFLPPKKDWLLVDVFRTLTLFLLSLSVSKLPKLWHDVCLGSLGGCVRLKFWMCRSWYHSDLLEVQAWSLGFYFQCIWGNVENHELVEKQTKHQKSESAKLKQCNTGCKSKALVDTAVRKWTQLIKYIVTTHFYNLSCCCSCSSTTGECSYN